VTRHFSDSERLGDLLGPGAQIGSAAAQLGTGVGTYAIGRLANSSCAGAVGADLLRAQLVAEALTLSLQYSTRRTRPDGSAYSFPSGHASVAFASAAVLQQQFGWKTGVAAYAAASYVAAARLQANRHFLSDVVFGAAVGMVSAHAATLGEKHRLAAFPSIAPGGGGIQFVWIR
jgi:membrane-associated phospholipid phosphatase